MAQLVTSMLGIHPPRWTVEQFAAKTEVPAPILLRMRRSLGFPDLPSGEAAFSEERARWEASGEFTRGHELDAAVDDLLRRATRGSAFAKAIGVSQARVSQMLGLLELGPRRSGYSMRSGIRTTHGRSQRGSSGRSPRFQKICNGPDSRSCWLLGDNANPAELSNVRIALRTVRYGHKMMCWIQR